MTRKSKSGGGAYEFTRAAYEEQRECELEHCVQITIQLDTTYQRGVYRVRVASTPIMKRDVHLRHSVATDWPNSSAQSFEAVLYQQVYKIARMCDEAQASVLRQRTANQETARGT